VVKDGGASSGGGLSFEGRHLQSLLKRGTIVMFELSPGILLFPLREHEALSTVSSKTMRLERSSLSKSSG
jgi:hypothetical protein